MKQTNKKPKEIWDNKPDVETESFRAWIPNQKEGSELEKDKGFKIKHGEYIISLMGFNLVKDKNTDKLIFAYKLKHEDKLIIYHLCEDISMEDKRKFEEFRDMISNILGYNPKSMNEVLKEVDNEKHLLEKLSKEKNKNKELK